MTWHDRTGDVCNLLASTSVSSLESWPLKTSSDTQMIITLLKSTRYIKAEGKENWTVSQGYEAGARRIAQEYYGDVVRHQENVSRAIRGWSQVMARALKRWDQVMDLQNIRGRTGTWSPGVWEQSHMDISRQLKGRGQVDDM